MFVLRTALLLGEEHCWFQQLVSSETALPARCHLPPCKSGVVQINRISMLPKLSHHRSQVSLLVYNYPNIASKAGSFDFEPLGSGSLRHHHESVETRKQVPKKEFSYAAQIRTGACVSTFPPSLDISTGRLHPLLDIKRLHLPRMLSRAVPIALWALSLASHAVAEPTAGLPSFLYGTPLHVECMNRS